MAQARSQVSSQPVELGAAGFENAFGLFDNSDVCDSESDRETSDGSLCSEDLMEEVANDGTCSEGGSLCHDSNIRAETYEQNETSLEAVDELATLAPARALQRRLSRMEFLVVFREVVVL